MGEEARLGNNRREGGNRRRPVNGCLTGVFRGWKGGKGRGQVGFACSMLALEITLFILFLGIIVAHLPYMAFLMPRPLISFLVARRLMGGALIASSLMIG